MICEIVHYISFLQREATNLSTRMITRLEYTTMVRCDVYIRIRHRDLSFYIDFLFSLSCNLLCKYHTYEFNMLN